VTSASNIQRNRVHPDVVIPLRNYLSINIGDEGLISSDVEGGRAIAVKVEEGLESNGSANGGGVSLIIPDPECVITQKIVLIGVVEDG
jgi:hypothetical protein